ncbi:C2 calcium-dependent membrane targeting [Corchorus capsularis]|uniref:C2 calcium-dependent membrane targeting n=1 Tax=Corchorus capsularis TaxID=210143 RepID=A0A1R3GHL8_COCAP|nr:C2 calcium-dependent membrane targeting [Corchorus capsularis]
MQQANVDFSLKATSPNIGGGRVSGSEKLTSSFDLVEQMHFLYVRLVRVRNLPGITNPFVEVKIGNYKGTTKYFEKKLDPEWNQVFAFAKDRIQAVSVDVIVKNKETENDQVIGKLAFDVPDIPSRVPPDSPLAPQWYSLEDQDGRKGGKGELMLAIWMGTQADEVFPDAWHSDAASVSGESISNTRSKVYISPRLWYLRVNIIQAQDLVPTNKNRNPEVYVKAMLGNMVLRSRFSPDNNINPTWNEDLMFVVAEPFDDPLILSVVDKLDLNKEDVLGRCTVHLSKVGKRLLPTPLAANWYNLERVAFAQPRDNHQNDSDQVKFASRLHLRICLEGGYHVLDESIYYSSDFRATSKALWPPTIGVLELGILNASGLLPMKSKDGRGTTDAYCVAKYGPKWVRTRTIVDSFAPKWNEQYTWEVYDPYTVITIGVFDNSQLQGSNNTGGSKDPRIGKVRIRLSTLNIDKIYTHSYPLIVLQPNGVKKMGEIQLAVRFTCSSTLDLFQSYTQPLFPQIHYLLPLTVYQIESLRHQATHTLSRRLSRAEPPLRREVVEYMLDVGSNVWSLRRGRANLERLVATFNLLVEAWKWFDYICKWKNPISTMVAHLVFLILALFPRLVLPLAFFMCIVNGASQFKNRPRHPPHMDTTLSLIDSTHSDELDEEFDTFPSSKNGEVLKRRYDRLRSVAGRMMTIVGDLATQTERFHSMVSWRDPRATPMFLAFCLLATIVFYFIPFRIFVLGVGFFAMRHPRFRISISPSLPQNFFRRLPARTDSMI